MFWPFLRSATAAEAPNLDHVDTRVVLSVGEAAAAAAAAAAGGFLIVSEVESARGRKDPVQVFFIFWGWLVDVRGRKKWTPVARNREEWARNVESQLGLAHMSYKYVHRKFQNLQNR